MNTSFSRLAGLFGILAGVSGFLYGIFFIFVANVTLYSMFLVLGGIFTSAVLVALYERLRQVDEGFALWALLLGLAGAAGAAIHGAYDLSNAIFPPAASNADLPSAVDPRGFLTFGVAGLAILVLSWLIGRSPTLPRTLSYVGYLSGVLLVILYLGRLLIQDPKNPIIAIPALLEGLLVNPVFYIWLGWVLYQSIPAPTMVAPRGPAPRQQPPRR